MPQYEDEIRKLQTLNLDSIIDISRKFVPEQYKNCPWTIPNLNHGTALLTTDEQMCCYMAAYGGMHQAKIKEALQSIQSQIFQNNDIQIVDWGCGQGLATICFLDYLNERHVQCNVNKVVLIEPSSNALNRAVLHVNAYLNDEHKIAPIAKYIDDVTKDDIASQQSVTLHFFSNILDIKEIDLKKLAEKVGKGIEGLHYFFCIGPLNNGNNRIDAFYAYFNAPETLLDEKHGKEEEYPDKKSYNFTAKYKVFKLENNEFNLIAVEYYPPVQFHAAYQLDCVQNALTNSQYVDKIGLLNNYLSNFEVATPFDIGASIYDDVHPILAVLNNIVTRGLPTKASPFLEKAFEKFGNKQQNNEFIIQYDAKDLSADDLFLALHIIDSRFTLYRESYNARILDSDLEKRYITEVSPKVFQQILQPQRSLQSITKDKRHYAQRVDFAFEYPYPTKDKNGTNRFGCVVEIDGNAFHFTPEQKTADQQRVNDLVAKKWYCIRIKEDELNTKKYEYLGSEYEQRLQEAYIRDFDDNWKKSLQLTLSPIAIARVQKTILEALMIDKLDINANEWNVMVIERDVPCAALAFADLKDMFNRLAALSKEYAKLKFPKVNLEIISTQEFVNSPLHNNIIPNIEISNKQRKKQYDLVIDVSVLRRAGIENITFSEFNCKNNCYFNIRSAHYKRSERHIYTSDAIDYKSLVEKTTQGTYDEIETEKENLQYFLQLLFRKVDFRSGQLPILSRALQNKSVIGLLPTGGGKSLTYQLAAILQPGVTIVVDPLRSLMKDQYDGLIKAGIDSCSFINSTLNAGERDNNAKMMEDSQLQFMFLSPERLCIYSFRERLRNMHELGIYFSYGVIDEVHCVSEWGHDFRFTYLHLGRNLYNYVLPKQTEGRKHISLFGLTATASFDVLADVERELSGNGAFPLDSDTIVRDENTNRLELQYKVERVPIEYTIDKFYDPNHKMPPDLPKALNISDKWACSNSKNKFLSQYIGTIPSHIRELQNKESQENIISNFFERQHLTRSTVSDLSIAIPDNFGEKKAAYEQAGIVFCPHKDSTGISVKVNAETISKQMQVGTFMGSGDSEESEIIDKTSFENLEKFRDNKLPLMVATKAFGMGIDKPNVRFTINMNYSSSLESFVQEAGRAGRDRHTALSIILLSDYHLYRINSKCPISNTDKPMGIIRNKWFRKNDLKAILDRYPSLSIDDKYIDEFSPERDMVKLRCEVCNKRFGYGLCEKECNECNKGPCLTACSLSEQCQLSKVPKEAKGFQYIEDLKNVLSQKGLTIPKENLEYINADYDAVMYFYNQNFKGSLIEKRTMHELLNKSTIQMFVGNTTERNDHTEEVPNFLKRLLDSPAGTEIVAFISTRTIGEYENKRVYVNKINNKKAYIKSQDTGDSRVVEVEADAVKIVRDSADVDKAIYRMCCIGLIDDFTKDYGHNSCRVVTVRKKDGDYYKCLQRYLERYYSKEKAAEAAATFPNYKGDNEIHKCLGFLTEFIYEKIAVKRKRAIDDMRAFCMLGIQGDNWIERNEDLKDFIYYYFNSKYARREFEYPDLPKDDKSYSLTKDTDDGKFSSVDIVCKYMKVVDDDITSLDSSSQIDNVKHLQGAVRLIRRSLTDTNPALDLLNAFCLFYLGVNGNETLEKELVESYSNGLLGFFNEKENNIVEFWKFFDRLNNEIKKRTNDFPNDKFIEMKNIINLKIHAKIIKKITNKYLS